LVWGWSGWLGRSGWAEIGSAAVGVVRLLSGRLAGLDGSSARPVLRAP
jgi:hypothetical protein